jgi:DNA repair exonuclease SbcCD ATPase subunit
MAQESLTLLKGDISKEARKLVNPKFVEFKQATFTVTFKMDSALADKLDTDARFVSKLYDDITKEYEELVQYFAMKWQHAEDYASILPLSKEEKKELIDDLEDAFEKYRKRVVEKAEDHVDKWLQVRKDRTKYTRSVATNVALGSLSIASGAVSAAAGAVSGGASLVMAIVSIGKGLVKLVREIKRVAADVGKAQTQVEKTVKDLEASYKNSKAWQVGLKEVGKSAVKDFLAYEMASIKRADNEFVTYKGKVAPLHEHTAQLGKDLNELLDKQTELDRKLDKEVEALLAKQKRSIKKLGEFQKSLEESRKAVMELITQIGQMDKVLDDHEAFKADLERSLKALHEEKPEWAGYVEKLVWLVSLGTNPAINAVITHGENFEKITNLLEKGYQAIEKEIEG